MGHELLDCHRTTARRAATPCGERARPAGRCPAPARSPRARLPPPGWRLRIATLSMLNVGLFFVLLFIAAERLPGGVAAAAGAVGPLVALVLGWPLLGHPPARVRACGRSARGGGRRGAGARSCGIARRDRRGGGDRLCGVDGDRHRAGAQVGPPAPLDRLPDRMAADDRGPARGAVRPAARGAAACSDGPQPGRLRRHGAVRHSACVRPLDPRRDRAPRLVHAVPRAAQPRGRHRHRLGWRSASRSRRCSSQAPGSCSGPWSRASAAGQARRRTGARATPGMVDTRRRESPVSVVPYRARSGVCL